MPDPEYLPDFAKQWMAQWRRAAVELQRVSDQELRQCPPGAQCVEADPVEPASGLVKQQHWFMRQRLLMAEARDD